MSLLDFLPSRRRVRDLEGEVVKLQAAVTKRSKGEQVLASMLSGGWNYGLYGNWSANRAEQARHFRGWNYVAIRPICEEFGGLMPHVAWVRQPEEVGPNARSLGRIVSKQHRKKALADIQPHEELELVTSDHPLARLIHRPNSHDIGQSFFYEMALYLELMGVTYIWVVPNRLGLPSEMWVIPAHWVRPHIDNGTDPNAYGLIDFYEVWPSGVMSSSPAWRFPPQEIISIMYPNPLSKIDGQSPQQACSAWVDCAESVDSSRFAGMKNGIFGGVQLKLDKEGWDPDRFDIERFKADFRAKYQGERNAKEPLIPPPGAEITQFSNTPQEMDWIQSGDQLRDWNLAIYRVSKSIAGIDDSMNYASMVTSVANFILRTMGPKRKLIGGILTEKLAKRYDQKLCLYWPDVTPDDPAQKLAENTMFLQQGVKAINEVRAEYGLEPYPYGGDDPMLPMGLSPYPMTTKEPEPDLSAFDRGQPGTAAGEPGKDEPSNGEAKPPNPRLASLFRFFRNGKTAHANGNGKG